MLGTLRTTLRRAVHLQHESALAKVRLCSSVSAFRTSEEDPTKLDQSHLGRFYRINPETSKLLFGTAQHAFGMPRQYLEQCETFRETCILVRRPFLTIKNDIESYGSKLPPLKFVLYGENGTGKSVTLSSLVHYGHAANFVVFHVPWVPAWTRHSKETMASISREGFIDHADNSVMWLHWFHKENRHLLEDPSFVISKDYEWNVREATPAGSPVTALIEHGIARPAYASEAIVALVQELKLLSTAGKCRVMVLIDALNGILTDRDTAIQLKRKDRTKVPQNQVTVFEGWRKFFDNDWTGGVCIVTVDEVAYGPDLRESYMPRYLLGKEGWEMMDPFIPIHIERYTQQEVFTCLDYFNDRKWLAHPKSNTPEARLELDTISVRLPRTLMEMCDSR